MTDNLNEMVDEETNQDNVESTEQVEVNVETSGDLQNDSLNDFVDMTAEEEVDENLTDDTAENTSETPAPAPKLTFADRAVDMGLAVLIPGTFHFADQFSEIAYKNVQTLAGESGVVDSFQLGGIAIFSKDLAEDAEWNFVNMVSDSYKFLGNGNLVTQIKESIGAVGDTDIQERSFMSANLAKLRHELVIMNGAEVAEIGSLLPMMQVFNTYNGTGASKISFGMTIVESDDLMSSFSSKMFGSIKQIHLAGASAELSASLGDYITIFNDNIENVISDNFANPVTPEEMTGLLDLIEKKVSKTRKEEISKIISPEEGEALNMNHWQLFLALTRFTSVEKNIDTKKILESVVESVLVLPAQMIESLKTINGIDFKG